ncbi:hypothetical protein THASP1DRAFT_25620 [Thamnocephalis sphaerospora]|uniref:Uncharacterized protein n=1 Tax=Thamnocephalis sphaerospora TaxID=78915 RepID=A0A4P9XJM9_9FUNG|nr:hypothetical protein THASP1DRAFT_25620 [Thamnocephalis sphaerospora]|eukprot:RKP05978.1 hypothetical protein THASP1DRAFT_25620 [Thamnocephalis sphaerospora]
MQHAIHLLIAIALLHVTTVTAADRAPSATDQATPNILSGPLGSIDISGLHLPKGGSISGEIVVANAEAGDNAAASAPNAAPAPHAPTKVIKPSSSDKKAAPEGRESAARNGPEPNKTAQPEAAQDAANATGKPRAASLASHPAGAAASVLADGQDAATPTAKPATDKPDLGNIIRSIVSEPAHPASTNVPAATKAPESGSSSRSAASDSKRSPAATASPRRNTLVQADQASDATYASLVSGVHIIAGYAVLLCAMVGLL